MTRWLVRASSIRPLMDGAQTPLGEVVVTPEKSDWAVMEIDGDTDESSAKLMEAWQAGRIAEFQPESKLYPTGIIDPPDAIHSLENRMGKDLPTVGVTPEWQAAVGYGANVILAICDTGHPPQAARDAHFPLVTFHEVYGGPDLNGHETGCIGRMVGPLAVLPECRQVVSAQALPNGMGTTTTVVQAIRACRLWRGPNGEKVHAINLSLGMDGRDPIIEEEVRACQRDGIKVCAAMGNSGWSRPAGTPATVAEYCAGATTFDGSRPASFTQGGCNLPEEDAASPGDDVGLAHLDGGYGTGRGTSFSAPVFTAIIGATVEQGVSESALKDHRKPFSPPRRSGLLQLRVADFGVEEPEEEVDLAAIDDRVKAIREVIEHLQGIKPSSSMTKPEIVAAIEHIWTVELGPIDDHAREIGELAHSGKAPEEPKPPTEFDSFIGSYGTQHSPAGDLYPGGADGPHLGVPFHCPADGRVDRYSFVSPLEVEFETDTSGPDNDEPVLMSKTLNVKDNQINLLTEKESHLIDILGTQMHIVVFTPDQPIRLENGQTIRNLWIGHVQPGFAVGRRKKGDVLALCGESGIEFRNGSEAAHGHVCGSTDGRLTPNGNVDGYLIAKLLGFNPEQVPVPGPTEYMSGGYFRGKPRQQRMDDEGDGNGVWTSSDPSDSGADSGDGGVRPDGEPGAAGLAVGSSGDPASDRGADRVEEPEGETWTMQGTGHVEVTEGEPFEEKPDEEPKPEHKDTWSIGY